MQKLLRVLSLVIFIIIIIIIIIICIYINQNNRNEKETYNDKINIFYQKNLEWELDYIKNDIFNGFDINTILFTNKNDFKNIKKEQKNIIILNDKYTHLIDIIKNVKPISIFYLSDEYGKSKNFVNELEKHTRVLFKHYGYTYSNSDKIFDIPLGYVKNFLKGKCSNNIKLKKISERKYNVSFVGEIKQDRKEMCDIFEEILDKTHIITTKTSWNNINKLKITPEELHNIYNDSIFVISGRGNYSLDCFRIYESIISGAIPVTIGTEEEIKNTFSYGNDQLPLLYFPNWQEAAIFCKKSLDNKENLQKLQDKLILWYRRQINKIQTKLKETLKD